MLPPKKHLKPIFCHENIIIICLYSRHCDENGRKCHKKKRKIKKFSSKKHLKPIFCHENNLFVKDDFETEHPDIGHKKRRTVRFSSQKTPKTHIHIMKTLCHVGLSSVDVSAVCWCKDTGAGICQKVTIITIRPVVLLFCASLRP